jgi:glucose-1-phosphate thymidylyltransferase
LKGDKNNHHPPHAAEGEGLIRLRGAPARDPSDYGVVAFNEEGRAERFVEKPRDPISNWALIGIYLFNESLRRRKKD